MNWTGRRLPRFEDPALLRGEGRYTADGVGDAACVRFLRSPVASGRINAISLTAALPPGCVLVTGHDLAGVDEIRPTLSRFNYVAVGQPVLPRERVHFVGQAVAAVIGPSQALAEDAADLVFVDIEQDAAVVALDAALRPDAPRVHPQVPGNVVVEGVMRQPGCDEAFAGAARVVTLEIRMRRQNATPLETRGGVASYDRSTGRVRLTASCQMPHMLRTGIAEVLDMPEADLSVLAPDVGGGFGQKMSLFPEYPLLVWLARRHRGRFAWIEDRNENLVASAHSRDQRHVIRGAFDADGTLRGLEVDILANVGAFSCYPTTCGVEPLMAFAEYPGPYKVPAYAARARGILTNTCPIAPYRGVSRPAITFGMERLMDRAAAQLGLEPAAIRRQNLVDAFPYQTATGLTLDDATYIEAMDRAVAMADLPGFRARQAAARREGRYLGLGFAVFNERTGYGTSAFAARGMGIVPGYEVVDIAMTSRGEVEVRIGASPHGQGLRTTLAQLVADQLGLSPDQVRVVHGDTDRTPYGWGSFASRGMVIAGGAAQLAAGKLGDQLRRAAGMVLQCRPDQVVLRDGQAFAGEASVGIAELARLSHQRSDLFGTGAEPGAAASGTRRFNLADSASYDPDGTFSNACHLVEVEVDIETGQVRLQRFLVVEDAGLLINPLIADGQVHGGVVQGIANALYEEIIYDEDGNILTGSLADYLLPTAAEVPEIEIIHLETISPASITGAKGLGEGGAIGAPAAIANAITDALAPFGVEVNELPATPARIRALVRGREARS
ncbi:MAG: xanthine dehydrogenase family protein molybdopterin-binding subunit [Janthinobacterium lividum]